MSGMKPIAAILPAREGFSPHAFGAVTLSVRDFARYSQYKDHITVFGMRDEEPYGDVAYEVLPVKRHWYEPNTRAYLRAIRERLEALQPGLIEVHNRPLIAQKLLPLFPDIPIALHLHNDPQEMKCAKTTAERQALLDRLSAIYCISGWVKARYLEGITRGPEKVHRIWSGITLPDTHTPKQKKITFIGRMTPNKGGLEYAEALAKTLPSHPDWHGYMIGGRRHAESVRLSDYEIKVSAIMEQIGSQAHFEGFYPYEKTMQMFAESEIVVIPSLWEEPFGRTGIEAIAHGCAVITSGRGGLKEIVGDSAIILEDVTGETIAEALKKLITQDNYRQELQEKAKIQAQQFAIEACVTTMDHARDAAMGRSPGKKIAA